MKRSRFVNYAGSALLLLGACKDRTDDAQPPTAAPHHDEAAPHDSMPTRVTLREEVARAAGIRTAAVTSQPLPNTLEIVGEIAADPDRAARIAARVSGRIVSVHAREGDRVRAGALLCVIESLDLVRTRAALAAAQARGVSARENATRLDTLVPSGLAARQEVSGATAESLALQAEASAAAESLRSMGAQAAAKGGDARLELRSPIDGSVTGRNATLGQIVSAEHVLFDVVDLDKAHFVGRLFEKSLAQVEVGATAEIRLNAYPDLVFVGTVESIGRQLDPVARTVVARLRIADPQHGDRLKLGLFGVARVSTRTPLRPAGEPTALDRSPLVVPLSALTRIADRDVVFVRQPDGHFELHPVTLGRTASGLAEVLTGLRAGEQVVVDGVFTLKSALLRSTLGED